MTTDIVQDHDVVADSEEDELSIPAGSVPVLKSPLKDIVNSGQTNWMHCYNSRSFYHSSQPGESYGSV